MKERNFGVIGHIDPEVEVCNIQTMYEHIEEQSKLAHTYAKDGAYSRAATILEELAKEVREHAENIGQVEEAELSARNVEGD